MNLTCKRCGCCCGYCSFLLSPLRYSPHRETPRFPCQYCFYECRPSEDMLVVHTHTYTRALIHAYTDALTRAHTHTYIRTFPRKYTCSDMQSCTLTHTFTYTVTCFYSVWAREFTVCLLFVCSFCSFHFMCNVDKCVVGLASLNIFIK